MKANPGGQIDLNDVVGREQLIEQLWDVLDQQSIVMTAERRIGKTTVIRKMRAEPQANWVPVFQDLEQYHSANDFVLGVCQAIEKHLQLWDKGWKRLQSLLEKFGGTQIAGIKLPVGQQKYWKTLLTECIADLVEQQAPKRLVFLWDEMPYMLDSIRKNEGEATAIEILDTLRALRQQYGEGFRMVLTGSIGLHHVLTHLKEADYLNAPVNDMYSVEVAALEPNDALTLAQALLAGENIECDKPELIAKTIASQGDNFPFYIHHIVREIKNSLVTGRKVTTHLVRRTVEAQLVDANDPWELGHYRDRISIYYPKDTQLVFAALDSIAAREASVSVNELLAEIQAQIPFDDRNHLMRVLRLLERDHYLQRDKQGCYAFRFPLIKRWWRLDRGL